MNPILKNVLAFLGAMIIGSLVNMSIIELSVAVIPTPVGVDPSDVESIKANIHLYEAKHFIFPFLAHALGTFVAAVLILNFAATNQKNLAYAIGALFLIFGIMASLILNAPLLASAVDILFAYIPMSYLAIKLSKA
jgi:hypothetical protein